MSTVAAPKLKEVQALAKTAISAASYFASGGTGANVGVVSDTGTQDKTVEKKLRQTGACVVVYPLLTWKVRDQVDGTWLVDVTLLVRVKLNPEVNSASGGAGVDIYEVCEKVTEALCTYERHPGGERFKVHEDAGTLSQFDPGLWEYDLLFTKEVTS